MLSIRLQRNGKSSRYVLHTICVFDRSTQVSLTLFLFIDIVCRLRQSVIVTLLLLDCPNLKKIMLSSLSSLPTSVYTKQPR